MNLHKKLGIHYFKFILLLISLSIAFYLMLLFIYSLMLHVSARYEWQYSEPVLFIFAYFIFGFILFFALVGFLYGRRMSAPIFYHLDWVDNLSQGRYVQPEEGKYGGNKYKKTFALYQELTDKMKKLTMRLRHNEKERQKLEKMRQEWTSGVTHDLKTPLSYIHGYSAMLLSKEHEWTEEERQRFLQIIQEKAQHIEQLIEDLSDVYQFEQGMVSLEREELDMVAFLRQLVHDIQQQPDALHHQLHFVSEQKKLLFHFDSYLLKRALTNLLINAITHNPEGTEIHVDVRQVADRDSPAPTALQITVADQGVGMNEDELELLFQRYYRGTPTDASASGTGLGMAIANQFIAAHRGSVKVKSSPGEGTVITIRLPYLGDSA